jgi:hypothetical protein
LRDSIPASKQGRGQCWRHRKSRLLGLRQAIALPLYAVALVLSFLSDALGTLAAKIAGDD